MRLALNPNARSLLRRMPRTTIYSVLELLLLSALAIQCARLLWTIVTPVGPVGEWRAPGSMRPAASTALLGSFDPFFRLAPTQGAPATVTSLSIKLFGVREDRATGRGAAIIATPDGQQRSFAVGEEIMPGVKLAAVGFDSVTIDRSGAMEQLFLDQSPPAPVVGVVGGASAPQLGQGDPAPMSRGLQPEPVVVQPPPGDLSSQVQFQPRLNAGRVNGFVVQPTGDGAALRAAGLVPGDVILSVNGQDVTSAEQAQAMASQLNGQDVIVMVERGGQPTPIRVGAPR